MRQVRRFVLVLASATLIVPGVASAASATQDAYGDSGDPVVTKPTPTPKAAAAAAPTVQATTASSLPFTGFEAGLIGLAGLGLVGTGVVLRRAARHDG